MSMQPETLLQYATQLRIPLTNDVGGYGEITIQRGEGPYRNKWAVTDGSLTSLQVWTSPDGWQPISRLGWAGAYTHTLDEAFALGRQVAEIEGACTEAQFNAIRNA